MTRSQLHEIAVRRRGDADLKTLLREITRLHGVLVRAPELTRHLVKHDGELTARQPIKRLLELLESEPAVDEQPRPARGKPKRPELEQRFPHLTEREEKKLARDKRG